MALIALGSQHSNSQWGDWFANGAFPALVDFILIGVINYIAFGALSFGILRSNSPWAGRGLSLTDAELHCAPFAFGEDG